MNSWKVIPTIVFATVLIFSAGVFTGGMLVDYINGKSARLHMLAKHQAALIQTNAVPATNIVVPTNTAGATIKPPHSPEILRKEFLQQLDGELHLTKDEHEAVLKIITDGQNAMRKVVQDARLEIRDVLTEEQRQQFDELMKRNFHKPLFGTNAPPTNAISASKP